MTRLRSGAWIGLCAVACMAKNAPDSASPRHRTSESADAVAPTDHAAAGAAEPRGEELPTAAPERDAPTTKPAVEVAVSLEELTADLDRLEAELRGEGVRLRTYRKAGKHKSHARRPSPPKKASPGAGVSTNADEPCARICAIATTVCGLRERICALADEHQDEPRYAAACERAAADCTRASEACDDCG